MNLRKTIAILSAFVLVFSIAGIAMAENTVNVDVNSEPIPQGTACSKAGGLSFSFDEGTVLQVGDVITLDTDYNSTLCRSFDFIVSPAGDIVLDAAGNYVSGTLWTSANTMDVNGPFTQTLSTSATPVADATNTIRENPAIAAPANGVGAAPGIVFRVVGTAKTQRVTIYVLGNIAIDYGADTVLGGTDDVYTPQFVTVTDSDNSQPEFAVLKILDEKTNPAGATPAGPTTWVNNGLWEVGATALTYNNAADWDDNTLCIDVSNPAFTASVVNANIDSKDDKFSFLPSNPQVAHIASPVSITEFECKVAKAGNIPLPTDEQAGCLFDYESGLGYCDEADGNKDNGRRLVLQRTGAFSTTEQYAIRLDIMSPTNVYWGNGTVRYNALTSGACPVEPAGTGLFTNGSTAYNSAGTLLTDYVGNGGTCTVSDANKAKTIMTSSQKLFTTASLTALYIDMPELVIDGSVAAGDQVQVKVTLTKFPCGDIWSGTVDVGTFGCGETTGDTTLYYPYFTAGSDDWWDGFVITNYSSTAGQADITLYEADGDQGVLNDVAVGGNSQYVNLLGTMIDSFTMSVSTGSGVLGDSTGYIKAVCNFNADGFGMMGEGTQAQGYLPRIK